MRKWLLIALLGLILVIALSLREGIDDTLATEVLDTPEITKCNAYWDGAMAKWANGESAGSAPSGLNCTKYAASWVQTATAAGTLVDGSGVPTAATKAQAKTHLPTSAGAASDADYAHMSSYAKSSGYADLVSDLQNPDNGALPSAITETPENDTSSNRPMDGDVFGAGGPFSGTAGNGQGSGANAAATLTGNTYGPSGQTTTLDPYDLYPSGKPKPPPPGTNLPVKGPSSGGRGASAASSTTKSSQPAPTLYGPTAGGSQNMGWGHPQINSGDTSALPSDASAGSDPSNAYAATSRMPGDMDLFPNPYIQSTTYSLANGAQKTDPVPFLTDFSAFQN
jgi:hypothetical protein